MQSIIKKDPAEKLFHQAASEVLTSLEPILDAEPKYIKYAVLDRLVEPERVIYFRVPWNDDKGLTHVNRGFRIQFNSAIGPFKGGIRFHESLF